MEEIDLNAGLTKSAEIGGHLIVIERTRCS